VPGGDRPPPQIVARPPNLAGPQTVAFRRGYQNSTSVRAGSGGSFLPARRRVSPVSVRLSVCLSVTSRCSMETGGRIDLVSGMEASFDQSDTEL